METLELIELWKKGDKAARDKLVEENMRLVYSIARRYLGRGYEMDDLSQIGSIGLIKAIDKFDTSFNVQFSTYAVPVIAGEIKRFLRDDGLIKISRSLKENLLKIKKASEKIGHSRDRDATIEELSSATGLSKEEVIMSLEADIEVESINKLVYSSADTNMTVGDRIPDKKNEMEKKINSLFLKQMLEELDDKSRQLIQLRYFHDKTQIEVAKILGISQVQVSRLEKKILLKLRENINL